MSMIARARALLGVGLVVIAVGGVAHAESALERKAAPLLKGCARVSVPGGIQFTCGTRIANVADLPGATPEAIASAQIAGIEASVNGEVQTSATVVVVGKQRHAAVALRVLPKNGKGPGVVFSGVLVAIPRPGGTRVAFCAAVEEDASAQKACAKLVPLLLQIGPAPYAVVQAPPMLAGVLIRIPSGCQLMDAAAGRARIGCGVDALLSWMSVDAPGDLPRVLTMLVEQLAKSVPGAARVADAACRVGGVATICHMLTAADAGGRYDIAVGGATVRGQSVTVQCMRRVGAKVAATLCDQAITW